MGLEHRRSGIHGALLLTSLAACGSAGEAPADTAGSGAESSGAQGGSGALPGSGGRLPNLSSGGSTAEAGGSGGSDDPAASVDCSFVELNDCVEAAVEEALGCLAADRTGTFAEDRLSCSFPEAGGEVRFPEPFSPSSDGFTLEFSLDVAGDECVSYTDAVLSGTPTPLELRTRNHVVRWLPTYEQTLECDGVSKTFLSPDTAVCAPDGMQSPALSKNVLVGDADVYFNDAGIHYLFRCAAAEQ